MCASRTRDDGSTLCANITQQSIFDDSRRFFVRASPRNSDMYFFIRRNKRIEFKTISVLRETSGTRWFFFFFQKRKITIFPYAANIQTSEKENCEKLKAQVMWKKKSTRSRRSSTGNIRMIYKNRIIILKNINNIFSRAYADFYFRSKLIVSWYSIISL